MHEILLEAGTNEAEFLEFFLGQESYGINVAKIKQLMKYEKEAITPLPDSPSSHLGTVEHLGRQIPVIDLCACLNCEARKDDQPKIVIITDFNQSTMGFLVDAVNKIHRLSWDLLQPISSAMEIYQPRLTGTVIVGDREMLILDFEHILDEFQGIGGDDGPDMPNLDRDLSNVGTGRALSDLRVMVVEDSPLFRQMLQQMLHKSGLVGARVYDNGMEALMAVKRVVRNQEKQNGEALMDLIITDIEMPQMDGLRFCKEVRMLLPDVPIIVLSSLVTEQMRLKCESVGADASISKKDLGGLYRAIRDLLNR
jgi:two-component system chemotaxis response regulator CheV